MKYFIIIPCILVLLSCREEVEPTPFAFSKNFTGEVSRTWVVRNIRLVEEGKGDQIFTLQNCIADDEYIFYNNPEKLFEVTNGNQACNSEEPFLLVSDFWAYNSSNATLTLVLPFLTDFPLPYIVREIEDDEMVLEIFLDENNSSSYRISFTLEDEA